MGAQVLVSQKKYLGKYVALQSFTINKVVASGENPSDVLERAQKKGHKTPVLLYVPEKALTHVY